MATVSWVTGRRIRRELTIAELRSRKQGSFVERTAGDLHAVANTLGVGEGNEAGSCVSTQTAKTKKKRMLRGIANGLP